MNISVHRVKAVTIKKSRQVKDENGLTEWTEILIDSEDGEDKIIVFHAPGFEVIDESGT